MEEELKSLGLSWNEIKAYKSLIKLGDSPVGQVIKDLKAHRQIVYNALEELESKGLVIKTTKHKIFHYKINDPKIFIENAKKQELMAERVSKNIEKILRHNRRESEINIYNGQEGIRKALIENYKRMPQDSTQYVWAADAKRHVEILGEKFFQEEYENVRKRRQIFSQNIFSENQRKDAQELGEKKVINTSIRQFRFLPFNSLSLFTTVVWDDRITMMSMGNDLFLIEIINQQLRDSYKEQFDLLWKIAKE